MKKPLAFLCALCLGLALAGGYGSEAAGASPKNTGSSLDKYAAQIALKVRRNFKSAPEWYGCPYSTFTHVEIDKIGRVLGVNVKKSSGNRNFDAAVVSAIRRTANFGPPPVEGMRVVGLRFDNKILEKS